MNYENNYIGYYCCSAIFKFWVMVGGLWKCNIGGDKYELWYIYND